MAQVPALFLPKKKPDEPTQVKKPNKKRKKTPNTKKVSAILQGRIDGYKKDSTQTYGRA